MGNLSPDAWPTLKAAQPREAGQARAGQTGACDSQPGETKACRAQAGSPFARLQLFRNPFGELTRQERADLAIVDLDDCLKWLQRDRAALQILGPCGHGKTTHLLALERGLVGSAYVYFPEDGQQPALPAARPLLVDEGQRLGWRRCREMLRGRGPLVIGTHVDLSAKLRRAGFLVRSLDLAKPLDARRLQSILNRRIAASAVDNPSPSAEAVESHYLQRAEVVALQGQFGSNIRLIEHHLYEAFQRFAEKGEPWRPAS